MSRRILRKPQVLTDLTEHYATIAADSESAAERFLQQAESSMAQLAEMPELGRAYPCRDPRLVGIRCFRIPTFKHHLLFYRIDPQYIEIIRVLHGARDIQAVLESDDDAL